MKIEELRVNVSIIKIDNVVTTVDSRTIFDFEHDNRKKEPIELTKEWLLKLGFECWGLGTVYSTYYESYYRYVKHNVLNGTSNFEVHLVKSTYGNTEDYEFIASCDEGYRLNWVEELIHVHQLQNLYFASTGEELIK